MRPNILILFTDDQRYDTVRSLGNKDIHTPNIDWLVKNGTSFNNAYIMGGTDAAVCMPSRAMLMTGRTLFHLENSGTNIPNDHTLLGELLQSNGFHCWGNGKWHNGCESFARSFNDGADVFFGGMYDHWTVPVHKFDTSGKYEGRISRTAAYLPSNKIENKVADHVHSGKHSTELFGQQLIDFLSNYDKEDPFFAYTAFMAPHDPRSMPQEFLDMYKAEQLEIGGEFINQHPFDNGELSVRDELLASRPRDKEEILQHIAEYYGMITHIDHQVGKIIKALKSNGQLDKTIIVFAGDNGLAVGRHGLLGKQNLYDHSIHIPLIFCGPNIPKGKVNNSLTYTVDIYPTLCDLVGIPTPNSVLGESLEPEIFGEDTTTSRDYLYFAYKEFQRAVQKDGWKLIEYNVNGNRHTQLFNLTLDPMETLDLSEDQSQYQRVNAMKSIMMKARSEFGDDIVPFNSFWTGF